MQAAVTMSTAPPMQPPWMAQITGKRRASIFVNVACMSVSRSKMAARPSGLWSSMAMAPLNVSSAMPALKCLPVLLMTSARAVPSVWSFVSTSSSSRQKVGCMVFIASGRLSTRWATWSSVELRKKQVGVFIGGLVSGGSGGMAFTVARGLFAFCPGLDQLAHAHAQQTDAAGQIHTLEAQAGPAAGGGGVVGEVIDRHVARHALEIVIPQLDADGFSSVALALQVVRDLFAEFREHRAQFSAVAHRVQVALEGGFSAHAHRLALGHHRALIAAPAHFVQPVAVALAEMLDQPAGLARRQFADGVDAIPLQLLIGLGAHPVDLSAGQRPDLVLQVLGPDDADAVGLVELARHLGDQLVGRHTDGAGDSGGLEDALLNESSQHAPALTLAAGHLGEVDVDLVHAAVLHHRRDLQDGALEQARDAAHFVKVHRQQDGLRAELGRLHEPHGRAHAELARRVGGGGDHAAPGVAREAGEKIHRDAREVAV